MKNVYPVPAQIVKEQIQAITEDMQIDALKIGMVTDESIIAVIADFYQPTASRSSSIQS